MHKEAHLKPFPSVRNGLWSMYRYTGRVMLNEAALGPQRFVRLLDQEARPNICAEFSTYLLAQCSRLELTVHFKMAI